MRAHHFTGWRASAVVPLLVLVLVATVPFTHHAAAYATADYQSFANATECFNGGEPKADGGGCVCPIYYTFDDCHGRQCPHSTGGSGPHKIEPVDNETQFCDHCEPGKWDGLNCQMCQSDAACQETHGPRSTCNRELAVKGNSKQFQCTLNSPFFIKVMGDGRNISAEVVLNCSSTDGGAFSANPDKAVCAMAIYRLEPDHQYVDPFFRCDASQCSLRTVKAERNENDATTSARLHKFRVGGQIALVVECALLASLGLLAGFLPHRLLKRLTYSAASVIVLTVVVFVAVMIVGLRSNTLDDLLVYECQHTSCKCAEDPPDIYQPICSQSEVLDGILAAVQNTIRVECLSGSGACQLTLADLAIMFDVECRAAECVVESDFPDPVTPEEEKARTRQKVMAALFALLPLSAVAVMVHCIYASRQSKARAQEFRAIFHLPEANAPAQQTEQQQQQAGDGAEAHAQVAVAGRAADPLEDNADPSVLAAPNTPEAAAAMALRQRMDDALQAQHDRVRRMSSSTLAFSAFDLTYTLPGTVFGDDRTILKKVSFSARSGDVVAIMGPSGAGKTTLLDLLAARCKSGTTTGEILLNGTSVSATGPSAGLYRNIIGYVSQEDTLLPALTVRQTIKYAARLKLPKAFNSRMIEEVTDRMIAALKLQQCEHTVVGDGTSLRGISGGEKRRVSIAVELVANPRILFLDEPTSGLDAISAMRVVEAAVDLAKHSPMRDYAPEFFAFSPIVIFSIHQPSQQIFSLFDKVLLLSDGVTVYSGKASEAAQLVEQRLRSIFGSAVTVPSHTNETNDAEYLMTLEEMLDSNARFQLVHLDQAAAQQQLLSQREPQDGASRVESGDEVLEVTSEFRVYYANTYQQLSLLVSRAATCLVASFNLIMCHAAVVACLGALMSYLYQEQELDLPGTLNRVGSCSFLLLVTAFVSISCLEQLLSERKLSIVERENCFYTTMPYLLSKILVDIIPLRVIPAVALASIIYFPMGFRVDNGMHFFWFILIVVLFSVCMTLIILCIGIVTGTFGAAALISSVFILWCFVFGGALVQAKTIPAGLRVFQSGSPFFLAFEPLMINELNGQACMFSPTDETGKESAAKIPIMCVQYLANIGLSPDRFSSDVMQLSVYCFGLLFLTWFLLVICSNLKR